MKLQKQTYWLIVTLLLLSFVLSACVGATPEPAPAEQPAAAQTEAPAPATEEAAATEAPATEEAAATEAPATEEAAATEEPAAGEAGAVEQVAVLLPASQTDQGWNQQAADSMTAVEESRGGFTLEVAENLGYGDITPVLRDLADRGFGLLICHASGYQTICPEFAEQNGVKVAVVENPDAASANVGDIETQAQEVAYLAGVLAANVSQSGTVGVVVSGEPPTWNFMTVGFAEGVKATNPDVDVLYGVIGEAAYEDAAGAKRTTETQLAAGADVIFGMGDGASFGMLQAIQEHNAGSDTKAWFIDVIGDKSADYADVLLSSVLFDYSGIYSQMLDDIAAGAFGKVYTMDVASGGVRLLDPPADTPAEALAAVDAAREGILSGEITVSAIGDAEAMRARLDELK
jgi:simple sugar transport system substrate-binding protein